MNSKNVSSGFRRWHRRGRVAWLLVLVLASAPMGDGGRLVAQDGQEGRPLSLEAALNESLAGNASLRIAAAQADMASAAASGASAVYWPRLDFESGFVRSNDPVFVFGTKLRQGTFSEPDFDVGALNNPDPINDWVNRISLQWKVFSPTD